MTGSLDHSAAQRPDYADSGMLTRVPRQYVVQASKSLPDPACALDDEMCVEIEAAWAGRVRLTFRKQRYCRPNGNTSYVSWFCRHAQPVAEQSMQKALVHGETAYREPMT